MNYLTAISRGVKPDPLYNLVDWSDEHRMLSSKASAEPGKWRTSRTPYLADIMLDLSSDSPVQEVVVEKGAQVGFTECGNNWLGYIVSHVPGPTLAVQPTLDIAKRFSKQRLEPLFRETPAVKEKVSSQKGRDSDNSALAKSFDGGILLVAGANSAAGLRSMPIRYLFLDEIDAYPGDVDGEGDPVKLAEARQRTFSKRKTLKGSTPGVKDTSKIHAEYEDSNQKKFYVPCPDCSHMQPLKFGRLKWPKGKPQEARYHCEDCDYPIANWQKTKMLNAGEWVEENPEHPGKRKKQGYHLNSLYSPVGWYSWEEAAAEYDEALADPMKMKAFVNTVLGLPWEEDAEVPDYKRLYERREPYKIGTIPDGVSFLTAGIDVQRDRIELEVVGWGVGKETWSIDYLVLLGDTARLENEVWQKLEEALSVEYPLAENPRLKRGILMSAIDSGFNTQTVYNWVRTKGSRVISVKGRENQPTIISSPTYVDVKKSGKVIRRGMRLWNIGVSVLKAELYGWLRQDKPIENEIAPGYCHFPEYDIEHFQQLTAEKLITKIDRRGFQSQEWHKHRERNEALDCRNYARVAAAVLGIDRFKASNFEAMAGKVPSGSGKAKAKPENKKARRSSGWL